MRKRIALESQTTNRIQMIASQRDLTRKMKRRGLMNTDKSTPFERMSATMMSMIVKEERMRIKISHAYKVFVRIVNCF